MGIDFGTTTTAVSIKIGDNLPQALPIGTDGVDAIYTLRGLLPTWGWQPG